MTRYRPGDRVRLRRGRVAHLVATSSDPLARFTLCGMPVLMDDRAALAEDPECKACYDRPAAGRRRHGANLPRVPGQ